MGQVASGAAARAYMLTAGNGPGKNEVSRHGGRRFSGALGTTAMTNNIGSMSARDGCDDSDGGTGPRNAVPTCQLARACTPARRCRRTHTYAGRPVYGVTRARACVRPEKPTLARANRAGRPRDNKPRAPPLHRRPLLPYRSSAGRIGVGGG